MVPRRPAPRGRAGRTPLRWRGRPPRCSDGAGREPPRRAGSRCGRSGRHDGPRPGPARSAARPQPTCPPSTRTASGCVCATRSKAATREATPLRGSRVPTKATSGRSSGTPLAARMAASAPGDRFDRREALVVHPVGSHDDRRPDLATGPQPGRGDLAHADEGPRPQGGARGSPSERAAPWIGRATPGGRRRCSRGSSRHRARATVRASCSGARGGPATRASRGGGGTAACSKSSRPGRDTGTAPTTSAAPAANPPSVPRPRGATPWSGRCRRARRSPRGHLHGVVARPPGACGDGRDVERQASGRAAHPSDRHSPMC